MTKRVLLGLAAATALIAIPASAHITLVTKQAQPGGSYIAVFKIPHGCEGASTIAVRVQIPAGVYGVKPMPKAGWKIEIVSGKYDTPFKNKDAPLTEGVTEVRWSGGNLPDAYYDEFTLLASLADSLAANAMVYFPVVQECEGGKADRWIEIPAAGKRGDDYKNPAPGVLILPK